jgi:hypothetical protein
LDLWKNQLQSYLRLRLHHPDGNRALAFAQRLLEKW